MSYSKKRIIAVLTIFLIICPYATVGAYSYEDAVEEFREALEVIDSVYYFKDELDYKELVDSALLSVFDNLDMYSNYMTIEQYDNFQQYAEPNKSGIGVTIRKNGKGDTQVLKVYKDSPAERAGLLKGDLITKIGGVEVKSKDVAEIRELIIGIIGTDVSITVQRSAGTKELKATRGTYRAPLVERTDIGSLIEGADGSKTAYVEITNFARNVKNPANDTGKQFLKVYRDLKNEGIKNLIIDLRDNSGGDVAALIEIAEVLVKSGVMFTFHYNSGSPDVYKSRNNAPEFNVAVLVNENTASSSEILASAIQESDSGIVIGTNTFGKGVGQIPVPASDGKHMMMITITEIITRNGTRINGYGVKPDIFIEDAPWVRWDVEISGNSTVEAISDLKKALAYLGYDAGTGTGYNEQLINAIKSFQKDAGMQQDGICNIDVIRRINAYVTDKAMLKDEVLQRAYDELNSK